MIPCRTRRTGNRLLPGSFREAAPARGWRQIDAAGRGQSRAKCRRKRQMAALRRAGWLCSGRHRIPSPRATTGPLAASQGVHGGWQGFQRQIDWWRLYGLPDLDLHYGACFKQRCAGHGSGVFGTCMESCRRIWQLARIRVRRQPLPRYTSPVYVQPERANQKVSRKPAVYAFRLSDEAPGRGSFFRFTFFFHVYK
ncbi:hypothetical protein CBM2587_A10182 [Cupriavidus taiwanensis]|uniref:Uncharacterized protein n=1 Tax=Cupriavidus taiwanensis TaxID=164546 RepID=A0A375BBY4_9BURK|nr:hypothetical protein CBM2587_A10182 [Cupriavidus taiwanensis]